MKFGPTPAVDEDGRLASAVGGSMSGTMVYHHNTAAQAIRNRSHHRCAEVYCFCKEIEMPMRFLL